MKLERLLEDLADELDRVHGGAFPWLEEKGLPTFITASNGATRYFSKTARKQLLQISRVLYENRSKSFPRIDLDEYLGFVRQAIADLHATGDLSERDAEGLRRSRKALKSRVEESIENASVERTHYFPAWTLGLERDAAFTLGPVTFLSRGDWLDSVDFHPKLKEQYLDQPERNNVWKECIKEAFENQRRPSDVDALAKLVYNAIATCASLIKVTVYGHENQFSRKLARLVAKTALDAISLSVGPPECFLQQALQDERLPPFGTYTLSESKGCLFLPGGSTGARIPFHHPDRVGQALNDQGELLSAFQKVLDGLLSPESHPYPNLANRWSTALDWFGEGCREANDAVALAKIATSLDVLSCGGKSEGILEMLIRLTDLSASSEVGHGDQTFTLEQAVRGIYDHGRSKVLHGTRYDRLEPMSMERQRVTYFTRIALIEAALRLIDYKGPDDHKGFRYL